jgi:hypothetical protein
MYRFLIYLSLGQPLEIGHRGRDFIGLPAKIVKRESLSLWFGVCFGAELETSEKSN